MPSNQSIRLTITVLIALTSLLFQQLNGQARPVSQAAAFAADTDRYIQETLAEFSMVPGIAIAVVRGEEIVYAKGFGLADVGARVAATAGTDYYIASSTKSFTSTGGRPATPRGVVRRRRRSCDRGRLSWTSCELR